jgi:hypothetical protein
VEFAAGRVEGALRLLRAACYAGPNHGIPHPCNPLKRFASWRKRAASGNCQLCRQQPDIRFKVTMVAAEADNAGVMSTTEGPSQQWEDD